MHLQISAEASICGEKASAKCALCILWDLTTMKKNLEHQNTDDEYECDLKRFMGPGEVILLEV
jgi:hypothetical protein